MIIKRVFTLIIIALLLFPIIFAEEQKKQKTYEEMDNYEKVVFLKERKVFVNLGNQIIINLNYPLTIKKQNTNTRTMDKFEITIPINFNHIYTTLGQLNHEMIRNPTGVPMSFIAELGNGKNFKFNLQYPGSDVVIVQLLFPDNTPLIFDFAVKYNWDHLKNK